MKMIECLIQKQEVEILSTIESVDLAEEHDDFVANPTHRCICKKKFTINDKAYEKKSDIIII
jgi:hypothetical protein